MHTDSPKALSKSALSFFFGTFFSRFSGMFRDMSMAYCFGCHPSVAAFMVAFRFANLFRRLIGEGPLISGFVPHFESLRQSSPKESAQFFRDLFFSLLAFLGSLLLIVEAGLWIWVHFGGLSPESKEILSLSLLMLPGVLFICLYGVSSSLLQCEKNFFLPGFAPVAFNLIWVGAVFAFRNIIPTTAMMALSLAIVIGFFMQWAVLLPNIGKFLRQFLSWKELMHCNLFSADVRKIVRPFLLGIIGIGASQINNALDAIFARFASLEGPAYLWYAIRVQQLPLALFGIALSTALLPPLSRAVCEQNWSRYRQLLQFSVQKSFSFIFPCTLALLVLAFSGVNLLYGRGDFDPMAIQETVLCLWGYSLGLPAAVFVLLLAPAFYAQKKFKWPTIVAVLSVLLNVSLNYIFVFWLHWGAVSIALATSVSAYFNSILLSSALAKKTGSLLQPSFIRSCMKTAVCGIIAFSMTLALGYFLVGDPSLSIFLGQSDLTFTRSFLAQTLQFFVLGSFFVLIFLSYAWMVNAEDVLEILKIRKTKQIENENM